MNIRLYYSPGFAAPIGPHIMPIRKFGLVAEALQNCPGFELAEPSPVTDADILRVHSVEYLEAIRTGEPRELAESQKFPWSPELLPSVRLTNGGVLEAGRQALSHGISAALASGFHHACFDHGEGFCTFNGLVIAADALRAAGLVNQVAVLDLDLHYGNGTASLAESRPWLRVLSLYGNDYVQNTPYRDVRIKRHADGSNHRSAPLVPSGASDGPVLRAALEQHLPWLISGTRPDLLLYQAGADPLQDDPYSPLHLDHDDLKARDRMVFKFARDHRIPTAWVLAGGYTSDVRKVVRVHVNTALAAQEIYGN